MDTIREEIRNIAIIAHVDHGKTTLVDAMLKQSRVFRDNQVMMERVMDSNDLERERGITILAKNVAVTYKGVKINIVDTPGHADFGGEVERVMNMVDGVLLLVDAVDGPMPQTRFVLRKALEMGHKAIVVINKVDRPQARLSYVANATFDLFIDLGATEDQADFPVLYTNAILGQATREPGAEGTDLQPLFDAIVSYLPAPKVEPDAPTQMLVSTLAYDDYKGRIAIGRLFAGTIRRAQEVARIAVDGKVSPGRISQVFTYSGLQRTEVEEAEAGEIVAVTGLPEVFIGETVADAEAPRALPPIRVEEPTLRMLFSVNNSPFGGREGTWSTSRKLRERLFKELESNVSLRVEPTTQSDRFIVMGRGELHLAILIETMRREGYEFEVAKPEVILRRQDGETLEPYEDCSIEVAKEYSGAVVESLGSRRGAMTEMNQGNDGTVHLQYTIPTRGLLGFRSELLTLTRGTGVINSLFAGFRPMAGEMASREHGSLVAWEPGVSCTYGLDNAEMHGSMFIGPGVEVYEGMVVGQRNRDTDLPVNVCKKKHLTNMRASVSDFTIHLVPPRKMSLDDCIEYLGEDELLEVTPISLRIRKRVISTDERRRIAIHGNKAPVESA